MAPRNRAFVGPTDPQNPEDLQDPLVADHLLGTFPAKMIEDNGHPVAAPRSEAAPRAVLTPEQMVKLLCDRLAAAFLKEQEKLPDALRETWELAFLLHGIDRSAVRVGFPFNAAQVRAGGHAVLHAAARSEDARVMKVDAPALGQELAQCERVRRLGEVAYRVSSILDANETIALTKVADRVEAGVKTGRSTIDSNGELMEMLRPALAIRGAPAADAQASRLSNERRDERTEEKVEARHREEMAIGPAVQTVTSTLSTPAPASAAAGAPKAPTAPGAPRK